MSKENYHISFSGGRTSGYMTKRLLEVFSDKYNFIITFANTGLEHPKTLEFIHNCDVHFGFNTVWLESVVYHGERKASGHRIVDFETASRKGEPFVEFIRKYGIPNTNFPSCTRDLKLNPMRSYLKSIGIAESKVPTAVGIRADEMRRVNRETALKSNIQYPLIDIWPTDKQDVLDWWEEQAFDLGIEEFEGNCQGCFKKSFKKHFMQIEKDPTVYDFHREMERLYSSFGPQKGSRFFFRSGTDTIRLFQMYEEQKDKLKRQRVDLYADGGCSESCEVYETLVKVPL